MDVIGRKTVDCEVRTIALRCFVAMVQVLHRSTPDQRQIELATILSLFHTTFVKFLSDQSEENLVISEDNQDNVKTIAICSIVNSVKLLMTNGANNVLIAQALVDANLLNLLVTLPKHTKVNLYVYIFNFTLLRNYNLIWKNRSSFKIIFC